MVFFVVVVIDDLTLIFLFGTSRRFSITAGSWGVLFLVFIFVAPPLIHYFLLFFTSLVGGFGTLFGLVGFILALALPGLIGLLDFFRLFVAGFDTHLLRFFFLGASLVQIRIPMNIGLSFDPIGFTD